MSTSSAASFNRQSLWVPILCGGLIMGLGLGIRHVQGLFMLPMTMDRAWSRETFALALAIQNLSLGLAQPFAGMLADRWGSARVIGAGTFLFATGLAVMAYATTPWALYLGCGVLIGVSLSCTAFGAVNAALSRLAPDVHRGWTLGMAGAIGGLGQFISVPSTQALQDAFGWQAALLVLGACIAAFSVLTPRLDDRHRLASASPAGSAGRSELSMASSIRQALGHRGFWLLNLGFLACGFQLAFIASHLPAYLLDKGAPAHMAVTGLALVALTNIVGTFACARLGDFFRRKYLLAVVYLLRTAAMALFISVPVTATSVYLFCAVMGLLWLGTAPVTTALVGQMFGVRYIGTLFGFVFLGHQLGAFAGVWLGGYVFDTTKSYDLVWAGAMLLGLLAAALHWPIDDRPVVRTAAAELA